MRAIRIDRSKPLAEEPHTGHNRYHPDIEPILEVAEGEGVVLETRDAIDGQLKPTATEAAFASINAGAIHPLTGPVHWKIKDGWATSEQIPGVRIPGAPFMGVSAVAPSTRRRPARMSAPRP